MQLIATDTPSVIIGMGLTGMACARYFCKLNKSFILMDTREQPPEQALIEAKKLQANHPKMSLVLGDLDADILVHAKQLILSPGIPKNLAAIEQAKKAGVPILGDIQLFIDQIRAHSQAKIIGVTGSNGKSTVVTALGLACEAAGLKTVVAGNIGVPVLDVLTDTLTDNARFADVYILELSSFQLELAQRAALDVASVLNVSADHMDRYPSLAHYCQAKLRIYFGAKNIVYNVNDMLTIPPLMEYVTRFGFSIKKPIEETQIPIYVNSDNDIVVDKHVICSVSDFAIKGEHNIENILAVLGILHAANIDVHNALTGLTAFTGLPHRCQTVREAHHVTYINDSKATNVGAAIAAIKSIKPYCKRIILIAGGDAKGASFSSFATTVHADVAHIITFGIDAQTINSSINNQQLKGSDNEPCITHQSKNLQDAVDQAHRLACEGDAVLLSPACASLDMFSGFEERGEKFVQYVEALTHA